VAFPGAPGPTHHGRPPVEHGQEKAASDKRPQGARAPEWARSQEDRLRSGAAVGKISDLITTGTAPELSSIVPMSM
jgi:hypothetical protein